MLPLHPLHFWLVIGNCHGPRCAPSPALPPAPQADIHSFLEQQQELKRRQRAAETEEERRIAEYMAQRREREEREAARKASKREAMDRCGLWLVAVP